jgi:hypothetical protein
MQCKQFKHDKLIWRQIYLGQTDWAFPFRHNFFQISMSNPDLKNRLYLFIKHLQRSNHGWCCVEDCHFVFFNDLPPPAWIWICWYLKCLKSQVSSYYLLSPCNCYVILLLFIHLRWMFMLLDCNNVSSSYPFKDNNCRPIQQRAISHIRMTWDPAKVTCAPEAKTTGSISTQKYHFDTKICSENKAFQKLLSNAVQMHQNVKKLLVSWQQGG